MANKINQAEDVGAHSNVTVTALPSNDAEFLDARGIEARFGLKRSLLYRLLADGSVHGLSLRREGERSGKRLFDVESVRAFLWNLTQKGGAK